MLCFFLFPLHLLISFQKKQLNMEEKWQGKGRQAVLVTHIPAFSICTVYLLSCIFPDYSAVGKYQPCAKDPSSKIFYIKRSRTSNSLLLSPLWVSPRTNSSLPLSVQALSFPIVTVPRCYLTLHYADGTSFWVPAMGYPLTWISLQKCCSEELSLNVTESDGGAKPLLSSASSPPASRRGPLRCLQEAIAEEHPTASWIRKHKACPAACYTSRIFPDGLQKDMLNPMPLTGNLLFYMGQGSWLYWWLSCPSVDLHKLFNYSRFWVQKKNFASLQIKEIFRNLQWFSVLWCRGKELTGFPNRWLHKALLNIPLARLPTCSPQGISHLKQKAELEVILPQGPEDHPAGSVLFSLLVKTLTGFELASC